MLTQEQVQQARTQLGLSVNGTPVSSNAGTPQPRGTDLLNAIGIKPPKSLVPGANLPSPFSAEGTSNIINANKNIADVVGGEKLAEGLGQTIANNMGAQKGTIDALHQGSDIETHLIQQIKADKAQGKDTTRLENALQAIGTDMQGTGSKVSDLGTGGLTNKEIIGSAAQLATDFIPTTDIAKGASKVLAPALGKVAPLAGKVLAGVATGYAYDVSNNLQNKDKTTGQDFKPGVGTAVGAALPVVSKVAGYLAKNISGFLSGTGTDAINRALENPDQVNSAINKYAKTPEAKQELVDQAKSAIQTFTAGKQAEYSSAIDNLTLKSGQTISKQPAIDGFTSGLGKFGVQIGNDSVLDFSNSTLTNADENNIKAVWSKINNWSDESPKGLDGLRQTINNFAKDFKLTGNTRANVVLDDASSALKKDLSSKLDGYSGVLSTYAEKSQLTSSVLKELQLGGSAKPSTQLKNIMNLFKKDPELQQKITDVMGKDGANKFMNELSGAIMSTWIPQGTLMGRVLRATPEIAGASAAIATGSSPLAVGGIIPSALASSPKIVGKVAAGVGKIAKTKAPAVIQKVVTAGMSKATN